MRRRPILALILISALLLPARAARAEDFAYDAGIGIASVFVNLVYIPVKVTYATLGGVTGGLAYLLTGLNYDVARNVWTPSLGGNYVVTPEHLRNERTLYFSGVVEPDEVGVEEDPWLSGGAAAPARPQTAAGAAPTLRASEGWRSSDGGSAPLVSPPPVEYE